MTHCIQTVNAEGVESVQVRKEIPVVKNETIAVNHQGYVVADGEAKPEDAYSKFEDENDMENALRGLEGNDTVEKWTLDLSADCVAEGQTSVWINVRMISPCGPT